MEINNIYGSKPITELGIIQQELLTARTEILKQQGISKELIRTLGNMKLDAIKKRYSKVKVLHDKYGACSYEWKAQSRNDGVDIFLGYYVKSIPLDGLSKHDKGIAKRYNDAFGYDWKSEIYECFKSFKEQLISSTYWSLDISEMICDDFLKKGFIMTGDYKPFTILLEG